MYAVPCMLSTSMNITGRSLASVVQSTAKNPVTRGGKRRCLSFSLNLINFRFREPSFRFLFGPVFSSHILTCMTWPPFSSIQLQLNVLHWPAPQSSLYLLEVPCILSLVPDCNRLSIAAEFQDGLVREAVRITCVYRGGKYRWINLLLVLFGEYLRTPNEVPSDDVQIPPLFLCHFWRLATVATKSQLHLAIAEAFPLEQFHRWCSQHV